MAMFFRRRACSFRSGPSPACLRPRHFVPLVAFLVPTAVIGYGVVLPQSCAAGVNSLSVGFATTLVGAAATYAAGVIAALRR